MNITSNLKNSIWPNGLDVDSEGYAVFYSLGTNKVQVPTSSSEWPKGTKLVSPFVYQNDKLVGFVDTKALTVSGNTTIYLPYTHIEADFSTINKGQLQIHAPNATTKKASWKDGGKEDIAEAQFKYKGCNTVDDVNSVEANYKTTDIVNGVWSEPLWDLEEGSNGYWNGVFHMCSNLTSFASDLPSLTDGKCMFAYCENLSEFDTDLPNLTNGEYMFAYCENLTSFTSNLSNLTDGSSMFFPCHNLTSFTSNLPNLTDGNSMFYGSALTSFSSDLSSLTNGGSMFCWCSALTSFTSDLSSLTNGNSMFYNCSNLDSFSSDLSSLTNGESMFYNCSKLTTFISDLSSLTTGHYMFSNCKLDTASIKNIADTIKTVTNSPSISIGIGSTTPTEEEHTYLIQIHNKGWRVYVNGSSNPYIPLPPPSPYVSLDETDETGESTSTPIPFWAKPEPATEEEAKYIDENGNFFNILGAQFIYVDDPETYGIFTCEEDAAANMRLTPYVKPQTETNIQNQ